MPVYIQNWYSAGAMFSSTADLSKFSDALFSHKILKKETLDLMLKPGLDQYGFGIWVYDMKVKDKTYKVYKRPGDIMGTKTMLVYLPEKGISIIILANTDSADLDDFASEIIMKLTE
jgi:CubicO group peptidase (beta-lactamase class C family)